MIRYLFILFTTISALLLTSCQSGSDSDEPRPEAEFKLSVALADMSRNGITRSVENFYDPSGGAISDNEKMQTLRIVIVRPDGTIEHNRYIDFSSHPSIWYGQEQFKVERGEDKEVYLFVNENSTTYYESTGTVALSDNNFIREGAKFPTDRIKNLTVMTTSNDDVLSGPLPMCEHHTIKADALGRDTTLFVTRAATKFTYVINNNLDKTISWTGLTLDKVARKEYYLPNNTTYTFTKDEKGEIISGVINGYEVATIQNNEHYIFGRTFEPIEVAKGEEKALPSFYLLESKYNDPGTASDSKLNYKTSITLDGITLESKYLPNLSQLPRNSHVVVYITIGKGYEISCTVDVRPYGEIILEPGFGQ